MRRQFQRGVARLISLLAIVVIVLMTWSHLRWDAAGRQSLVLLDSLNQSRHASRDAELATARALLAHTPVDESLVITSLSRARLFVEAMMRGEGGLSGMRVYRMPAPELEKALQGYERELLAAEQLARNRLKTPQRVLESDIRASTVRVDAAAIKVEAVLLRMLERERTQQRLLDGLNVLIAGLLSLGSLALLLSSERRNANAYLQIQDKESRLRAITAAIPGTSFVFDAEGRYEEVFGQNAANENEDRRHHIGRRLHDVMPAALADRQLALIQAALASNTSQSIEYAQKTEDGLTHHFEGRMSPLGDAQRVVWVSWDVSERWQATQRVLALKRLYEFLSNVNQAIVWSREQDNLFEMICRTATTIGGFELAWISWQEEAGKLRSITRAGRSGILPEDLLETTESSVSPTMRTFLSGDVLLLDHIDAMQSGWAAAALEQGLNAYAGIPLMNGGTHVGVLNLLHKTIDPADKEELALLREVGIDLSYAITLFSGQARQRQTESRVRLLAAALESCQDGVMVTDTQGHIVSVNRAFTYITGYQEAEALGRTPSLLHSGQHDRSFYANLWNQLQTGGCWQGEIWNRRKSGEVYAQWMSISIVHSDDEANHYVAVFTDISHIKDTEERLRHLAHFDLLTGLPNRSLLNARLEHALTLARRQKQYLAVLFIDLDNFKHVNDALGHAAGDELLIVVTKRLASRLRQQDTLGRLGGDEFLLILESLHAPQDAAVVATDLLAVLDEPFALESGQMLYVRVSIGISIHPDDGNSAADLIREADAAMYQAKRAGRSTYRYYTEELTAAASYRLELEARLRRAFDHDEFSLHFQPLVRISDQAVIGAEVLVRLQPPGMEPVSPATFIPLLEETGLIVRLGEWVLRKACEQGRSWLDAGYDFGSLAVNVSPIEIRRGDFVERLRNTLASTDFPATMLEIELTESGMMEQGEFSERFISGVRETGARLSIDDFGTGYSSLSYLRHLPVDKLKIDRSFISEIPGNAADVKLTATIIAMTRNLGIKVLAEGVETEAQLEFLREQGCDACQGYLFSRPLPAEEYEAKYLRP